MSLDGVVIEQRDDDFLRWWWLVGQDGGRNKVYCGESGMAGRLGFAEG